MGRLLVALKPYLITFLEKKAVSAALRLFFKSAIPGGLKAWLIKFVVKEILFDKAITPAVQGIFRELGYAFNTGNGGILIKRLKKAEDENDEYAYDDILDDILS